MSFDINFHVKIRPSVEQRTPLAETVSYAGHTYQIYEVNELFPHMSTAQAIKKTRAIFLNEQDPKIEEQQSIKNSVLAAVKAGTCNWKAIAKDKDLMLEAIVLDPENIQHAHEDLRKDADWILSVVDRCMKRKSEYLDVCELREKDIQVQRLFCTKLATKYSAQIASNMGKYASDLAQDNSNLRHYQLKYKKLKALIDPALLGKKEFILRAMQKDITLLLMILSNLETEDFFLEAIQLDKKVINYLPNRIKDSIVQTLVKQDPKNLCHVSVDLMMNKEFEQFVINLIRQNPRALENLHNSAVIENEKVILASIPSKGDFAFYLSSCSSLFSDKQFILQAVSRNGHFLNKLPNGSVFKGHRDIVLAAIRNDWTVLNTKKEAQLSRFATMGRCVPSPIEVNNVGWNNKELAMVAVEQSLDAIAHCPASLKKSQEFIDFVFTKWPDAKQSRQTFLSLNNVSALSYADQSLTDDLDFMKQLCRQDFKALAYAPVSLRQDREFIKSLIADSKGEALIYADASLKQDREFVNQAIVIDGYALGYSDPNLMQDPELITASLKYIKKQEFTVIDAKKMPKTVNQWNLLPKSLKNNQKFMEAAFLIDSNSVYHTSIEIQRHILIKFLETFPLQTTWVLIEDHLRNDLAFMLAAFALDPVNAWQKASDAIQKDPEFVKAVVDYLLMTNLKKEAAILALQIRKTDHPLLSGVAKLAFQDKEIVLQAFLINQENLKCADPTLLQDREFIIQLINIHPYAFLYIPQKDDPFVLNALYQSLSNTLAALKDDPSQIGSLKLLVNTIISHANAFRLHPEHPLMQEIIQAHTIVNGIHDPKNPYYIHAKLLEAVQKEALLDDFEALRKRADLRVYTFADIPEGIIPFHKLFESVEERGINPKQLEELCQNYYGKEPLQKGAEESDELFAQRQAVYFEEMEKLQRSYLSDVRCNILGQGKVIPALLLQRGDPNAPITLTNMYLHLILKKIAEQDNTRKDGKLSDRENMLLQFASMVKECSTGQSDAIEQYFLHTIGGQSQANSSVEKIEKTIDSAVQMTLLETLSSDALVKELTGKERVKQMSHQTLYLKNRYYKQLGLHHSPSFDFHAGVIYQSLQHQSANEALSIIKHHFLQRLEERVKEILDRSFKESIAFQHWVDYFKNHFDMQDNQESYNRFFDNKVEEGEEIFQYTGIAPVAIKKMLVKLLKLQI
jgi:hypothetical protein